MDKPAPQMTTKRPFAIEAISSWAIFSSIRQAS
jgi:hypothetical protein